VRGKGAGSYKRKASFLEGGKCQHRLDFYPGRELLAHHPQQNLFCEFPINTWVDLAENLGDVEKVGSAGRCRRCGA